MVKQGEVIMALSPGLALSFSGSLLILQELTWTAEEKKRMMRFPKLPCLWFTYWSRGTNSVASCSFLISPSLQGAHSDPMVPTMNLASRPMSRAPFSACCWMRGRSRTSSMLERRRSWLGIKKDSRAWMGLQSLLSVNIIWIIQYHSDIIQYHHNTLDNVIVIASVIV